MRWYEKLYVGEKAKKHRYETIQAVRNGRPMGFYVLTPAAGERNLLDIYPALTLKLPYYEKQDLLIVGIAADFEDAAALRRKTGRGGGGELASTSRADPGELSRTRGYIRAGAVV